MLDVFLQATADIYMAPILVGLVLAFVTQAVASWVGIAGLKTEITGLCDDMKELQELHPRKGNPGERRHDPQQFCLNSSCLSKIKTESEEQ